MYKQYRFIGNALTLEAKLAWRLLDLENANHVLTSLSFFWLVMQKPASMASAQDFFKPLNDACAKAAAMTEGRRPDHFNHMKSVADSLAALAWVAFLGKDMG
jgi:hypothetical protein